MRFGLDTAQHQQTWAGLLERVRFAEDAGFDGAWLFDHFKALYGDPRGPCLEGWTLLAGLAASTTRIRLGTLVTGITYRHPSVLAAEALTVDHLSGGRLELAVGAAWLEEEHRELGIPFPPARERADRLEEGVQVLRLLMTEDRAMFDGAYYRLDGASLRPRPVQRPHVPMWIGGNGEHRTIPTAARHADAWHGWGSVEELRRLNALLDRHAADAGRDPSTILRAADLSLSEPWDEVRSRLEGLRGIGVGYVVVGWPSEGQARIDAFVSDVMPSG
jgi:F420-dependent oxidoreductase-like protein